MTDWNRVPFLGGHPALDFVNTVGGATRVRDVERLADFADAVAWARHVELVDLDEADALLVATAPDDRQAAVVDLRDRRERLHAYLTAAVGEGSASPDDVRLLQGDVVAAYRAARLVVRPDGPAWVVDPVGVGASLLAHRVALATAALLTDERRRQVRLCGRCSWVFLDPSPTGRRRWCSMAICGNRAKASRHHSHR